MLSKYCFVLFLITGPILAQPVDTLLQKNNELKITELYQRLENVENPTPKKTEVQSEVDLKITKLMDSIILLNKKIESLNKLTYMVQFYLSKKEVDVSKAFKGLEDIAYYKENDEYKYTIGHFEDFEKAQLKRKKMIELGYKDAFVLMIQNGKRIN